jgi:two-component system, LytTR family, response regulator AlgR
VTRRVLIVDDEQPARERLGRLLGDIGGYELAGECATGDEALQRCSEINPDIVLLDVRMPGMSGLETARHMALLNAPPAVIFTTAYDEYAVEAFEAEAVGYLLKPVRSERLATALERATRLAANQLAAVAERQPVSAPRTHVAARLGETIKLIPVPEIFYFSADQKYTTMRHRGGSDLIDDALRALEEEFAADFVRIHRSALVHVKQVAGVERIGDGQYEVLLRDLAERLPVSRRQAGELRERFGF